jgi:hypothetical protein
MGIRVCTHTAYGAALCRRDTARFSPAFDIEEIFSSHFDDAQRRRNLLTGKMVGEKIFFEMALHVSIPIDALYKPALHQLLHDRIVGDILKAQINSGFARNGGADLSFDSLAAD